MFIPSPLLDLDITCLQSPIIILIKEVIKHWYQIKMMHWNQWRDSLLLSAVSFHTSRGRRQSVCVAGGHRSAQNQVWLPQHHHPGGALLWRHEPLLPLSGPQWLRAMAGWTGLEPTGHTTGSQAFFPPLSAGGLGWWELHPQWFFFFSLFSLLGRPQNHPCVGSKSTNAGAPC